MKKSLDFRGRGRGVLHRGRRPHLVVPPHRGVLHRGVLHRGVRRLQLPRLQELQLLHRGVRRGPRGPHRPGLATRPFPWKAN